ncbi:hypothetical protein MTO96_048397 [Rhipicephalus appendiculatus]
MTVTVTDSSLINAILTRTDTEHQYLTYITALFTYQPILCVVAIAQTVFMIGSFVGGLFVVLARMVGAFGGRKVQNITVQYMRVLHFYTVLMVILVALNAVAIFCLWGSTNHFAIAVEKGEKVLGPGVLDVQRYIVGTVKDLRSTLADLKSARGDMFNLIISGNQDYRANIKYHSDRVLTDCGLPTPSVLASLKDFLTSVRQECASDDDCKQNVDDAEAARLKILNVTQTIYSDFQDKFNASVENFLMLSPIQTEFDEIDRNDLGRIKKINFLESAVIATHYPNVTSMGILGSLSPYDGVFAAGEEYSKAASTAAIMLESVAAVSFGLGVLVHSPDIPPNKRGFISNQCGVLLVVSTLFMWLFSTIMAPSSVLFMMGGVISQQYICEPYSNNQLNFLDDVVFTMFVPQPDEDFEVAHQAEYNFKAIEIYNTTMKPSTVLRSCIKNETLLAATSLTDLKTLETAYLVANPPKYLYRLINGTAFSARGYSDDWKGLIGTDLDDLATPVEKLSDSLTTDTGKGPINNIVSAKAYVAKWRQAEKKLYDCWDAMEIALSNQMNADHYNFIKARVSSYLANIQALTDRFYTLVGSCLRVGTIYKRSFDVFCYAILANLNGVWFALWLVCLFFSVTIVVILKLSKYFMRMDDYMYEGVSVEESIATPPDDKTSGTSISYAPRKFESNPYKKPDLEEILCYEDEVSDLDQAQWEYDRTREFVPESLEPEVRRVREIRQRMGIPANQPLPIGGQPPMRPMGRGAGPRGTSPRGPSPRAAVPPGAQRAP